VSSQAGVAFVLVLLACSSEPRSAVAPASPSGRAIEFAYGTPSGEVLTSGTTRGRVTALLFVATFDLSSQLMAKRLDEVIRRHRPRANAGAIALEAPNDAPLVDVFRSSLALSYPVALTNTTGFERQGPFGTIDQVPTLVVLDARGREVARAHGVVSEQELDLALTRAER
jgi:hypothetical protein